MAMTLFGGARPVGASVAMALLLASGCGGGDGSGVNGTDAVPNPAEGRTVEVYFTYTAPRAPCDDHCEDINVRLSGFRSNTTYSYSTNIESSVDGSIVGGSVATGGDGRAEKRVAVYNTAVYDETYCVTVDGIQGCKKGN